jgi:hypothetical protein
LALRRRIDAADRARCRPSGRVSCRCPDKADDAAAVHAAQQPSGVFESIEVGDRLAHGEHRLVRVEIAWEQGEQQLAGAARTVAAFLEHQQALFVVGVQGVDPVLDTVERQAVRGQYERGGRQLAIAVDRLQVIGQRIGERGDGEGR